MARLKRKALKAHKKKHETWQKYAKAELNAGRKPIKFKDYKAKTSYFGKTANPTTESRLKAAGIDWEKDKPSARLKRKKK